jgi:GTP-binding protein
MRRAALWPTPHQHVVLCRGGPFFVRTLASFRVPFPAGVLPRGPVAVKPQGIAATPPPGATKGLPPRPPPPITTAPLEALRPPHTPSSSPAAAGTPPVARSPAGPLPRRLTFPLFGLASVPLPHPDLEAATRRVFADGAQYLGNHYTLFGEVPPKAKKKAAGEASAGTSPAAADAAGTADDDDDDYLNPPPPPTGSAALAPHLMLDEPPWSELIFMGRSNVGKSSLLSALMGAPTTSKGARRRPSASLRDDRTTGGGGTGASTPFVPVSSRPGTTSSLDFYGVGRGLDPELVLVDSPGYGHSQAVPGEHVKWMRTTATYLRERERTVLRRVFVLVDARRGIGELDKDVLSMLDRHTMPVQIVLTKVDCLPSQQHLELVAAEAAGYLSTRLRFPFPVLQAVSAKTGEGVKELQMALVQAAKLHL